jgi:hypothetical protein
MISSAISRFVQWLMGRPESSGSLQAMDSIRQRWSAVIRGGAPGRARSSRRSSTLKSSNVIGCRTNQRLRHRRTVLSDVLSSLAICELLWPSSAAKTIRPRSASCCGALCRLTNFSTAWRSSVLNCIAGGFGPGIRLTSTSQDCRILTGLAPCVKLRCHLRPSALVTIG